MGPSAWGKHARIWPIGPSTRGKHAGDLGDGTSPEKGSLEWFGGCLDGLNCPKNQSKLPMKGCPVGWVFLTGVPKIISF